MTGKFRPSDRVMSAKNKGKKGGFSKRFRCGRVMINKDGEVKKVGLGQGGGSRYCKWYHKWMSLHDVRRQLVHIFDLNDSEDEILLYDFQLRPLDVGQYHTVFKYVNDNGLNCNGTLLHLCTHKINDDNQSKKVSSSSTTANVQENVIQTESDVNLPHNYLEYPFKNTIDDLVKNVRHLFLSDTMDETLIKLFENCCILYGYVCSTIHPIQQHQSFQSMKQSEHLNDMINICKSIKTLIDLNKEKLNQIENFSSITNIFTQFYRNLQFWFDHVENMNKSNVNQDRSETNPNILTKKSYVSTRQEKSEDSHSIPFKQIKLEKQNHDDHHRPMDIATYSSSNV